MTMRAASSQQPPTARRGIALVTVLYFILIGSLASAGVFMMIRGMLRNTSSTTKGAQLVAAAEEALYSALANWDSTLRMRQAVGSAMTLPVSTAGNEQSSVSIARLSTWLFAIVADARNPGDGASRRVSLLVRLPSVVPSGGAALLSAADVTLGPNVRVLTDSSCGDIGVGAIALAPGAALSIDAAMPADAQPTVLRDSSTADSAAYLRIGGRWWTDLVLSADIRLSSGAHVTPMPTASDGLCASSDSNWGDPTSSSALCAARVPVIYANGDLTVDGGVGQGVLLVAGHLTIAGPFTFSGQIVARGGIEDLADNITISGAIHAWRARDDSVIARTMSSSVELTHQTTLRFSRCDAWHGMASWLQPRRVREHAWSELF